MKLFTILLMSIVLLTGCEDDNYYESRFARVRDGWVFTPDESAILASYITNTAANSNTVSEGVLIKMYKPVLNNILLKRSYKEGEELKSRGPQNPDKPLCEAAAIVRSIEVSIKDGDRFKIDHKFSKFYEESFGFPLTECNVRKAPVDAEYKVTSSSGDIKLSPSMYDELVKAVSTCKRAELAAISGFSPNKALSQDDYDKAMTIILDCKKFQLEKALNEK